MSFLTKFFKIVRILLVVIRRKNLKKVFKNITEGKIPLESQYGVVLKMLEVI
jgi:hypothetical protein